MKSFRHAVFTMLTAIVLSLLTSIPAIQAQTPSVPATNNESLPPESELHQELRDLKKLYEDSVSSGNLQALAPYFGTHSSGVIALDQEFHTLAEMQKIFDEFKTTLGPGYSYSVALNPERSQIYGDIAVCLGTSNEFIKSRGHEFKLNTNWTAVLHRENGQWHLLRLQVTMDPFHNPVTDYFFTTVKKIYGFGGLVIGVILGSLAGFIIGRRRKSG